MRAGGKFRTEELRHRCRIPPKGAAAKGPQHQLVVAKLVMMAITKAMRSRMAVSRASSATR